jgi:hypothetical protein
VQNSVVQPTTQIVASLLALGVGLSLVMVLGVIRPLYIQIQRLTTRAGLAEFGLPRLALGALVALMLAVLTNYLAGASAAVAFATGFSSPLVLASQLQFVRILICSRPACQRQWWGHVSNSQPSVC